MLKQISLGFFYRQIIGLFSYKWWLNISHIKKQSIFLISVANLFFFFFSQNGMIILVRTAFFGGGGEGKHAGMQSEWKKKNRELVIVQVCACSGLEHQLCYCFRLTLNMICQINNWTKSPPKVNKHHMPPIGLERRRARKNVTFSGTQTPMSASWKLQRGFQKWSWKELMRRFSTPQMGWINPLFKCSTRCVKKGNGETRHVDSPPPTTSPHPYELIPQPLQTAWRFEDKEVAANWPPKSPRLSIGPFKNRHRHLKKRTWDSSHLHF